MAFLKGSYLKWTTFLALKRALVFYIMYFIIHLLVFFFFILQQAKHQAKSEEKTIGFLKKQNVGVWKCKCLVFGMKIRDLDLELGATWVEV